MSEKYTNNLMVLSKKKEDQVADSKIVYFDNNIMEKVQNRNETAEKMRVIEKKYNKVFSYIKKKQELAATDMIAIGSINNINDDDHDERRSKLRSASVNKISTGLDKRRGSSTSIFKIKTTVSSANKLYF